MDPQRTCVGCRRVAAASALRRVGATTEGRLFFSRHADGRGAWVCLNDDCLKLAISRKAFPKAFRRPVDVSSLTDAG